ncbi:tRNA (adenosine(37)-N6)-threonylcarbamoyltransferase complex dimerization subunit type 1 TsaB [Paracoccus benzoatiresistens]|uniref:tRNA (Adenosine(37)-N6)-threonylcarbamoyltransferase complex dimerization subunit type 1 TsaB n=1 Tax=Paracoccus benzoatiresistens TaxID=2997341 RepID=A0ABT4IZT3_9RHOB|nr:tRNA (adenosine(37)-N6)-threonylcarbamoyltransferase complex dimerization subunit type 1 TsaB [Paracoccus sp. EF6]MCZ0960367.1 tRNA (adenosine(37)-N6)-threonylcarbamoyltransferase complex dimerization subunit type 1 TsaB [Paracoccus sp. EF6]
MPDPLALGLDTSAAHCAAALLRGDAVLAHRHEDMAKGQAERLFPLLEDLLADAGLSWHDLDVIGVGVGPGNFTGIRIAVAAARGLALSLGIPAVGVTATKAAACDLPRPCRVVLPLRADQVAWQDFGAGAGDRPQQAAAGSLPPGPEPSEPLVPPAIAIARIALSRRADPGPRPAPLYLRPADAAPPRDPAPLILP